MKAVTLLLLSGIGAGLLGATSASAAPANGAIIGEATTAWQVTQQVVWRGRAWGWRGGWGWRNAVWRRGWRPGLSAAGFATPALDYGWDPAWGWGWGPAWGWGWAPALGPGGRVEWRPARRVTIVW
jgi:hypothetical protein